VEGDLQRTFGINLRRYRNRNKMSQEALAELLEVHRTYVGGLERGERNPSLRTVEWIANRLGVDPYLLLRKR